MPRKVILGFGVSLDGYIARRNGAFDFLAIDQEGEALMFHGSLQLDAKAACRFTGSQRCV